MEHLELCGGVLGVISSTLGSKAGAEEILLLTLEKTGGPSGKKKYHSLLCDSAGGPVVCSLEVSVPLRWEGCSLVVKAYIGKKLLVP